MCSTDSLYALFYNFEIRKYVRAAAVECFKSIYANNPMLCYRTMINPTNLTHRMQIAFGGLATPPGKFNGALVNKKLHRL